MSAPMSVQRTPPTPLLFQWGRQDTIVIPAAADELFAAAQEPKTAMWYNSGHALPTTALADRIAWLTERLAA